MKLQFFLVLMLFLSVISKHNIFSQSKKQTVAILEFKSTSEQIGKDELATLTNRFRTNLAKTDVFDVLEQQKMSDILKEQNLKPSDDCNSTGCVVQIGRILGVELMIDGDIGKLGNTYSVDLRLISVTSGKILQTEIQDHNGEIDGLFGTLSVVANSFASISSNASSDLKENNLNGVAVAEDNTFTDPRDGKKYKTVKIGNQIWMADNLDYQTSDSSWYYNNDSSTCRIYGRLYTWNRAMTAAPPGWHVPADDEWTTLIEYLGGKTVAGGKMKETGRAHWSGSNISATGDIGFTALPGGYRSIGGTFYLKGYFAVWWSATEDNSTSGGCRNLDTGDAYANSDTPQKNYGFSVRCVKD